MSIEDELRKAVRLAQAGSWNEAHAIVQRYESDANASWIHAVLHKMEGDSGNSQYWYRRAGKPAALEQDAKEELAEIARHLE